MKLQKNLSKKFNNIIITHIDSEHESRCCQAILNRYDIIWAAGNIYYHIYKTNAIYVSKNYNNMPVITQAPEIYAMSKIFDKYKKYTAKEFIKKYKAIQTDDIETSLKEIENILKI